MGNAFCRNFSRLFGAVFRNHHNRVVMVAGLLSLIYCFTLFTGTTQAAFMATASTQSVQYASKWFRASYTNGQNRAVNGAVTLKMQSQDEDYFYTLHAQGSTRGYGIVTVEKDGQTQTVYIAPVNPEDTITVSLHAAIGSQVHFDYGWGAIPPNVSEDAIFTPLQPMTFALLDEGGAANAPLQVWLDVSDTPAADYTVPAGATLEAIAAHYKVSPEDILTFNDVKSIRTGDVIRIPNPSTLEPYEPAQVYIVVKGDTLRSIADAHNVTVKSLCQWNDLSENSIIYENMRLLIPVLYENEIQEAPDADTVVEPEVPQPEQGKPTEPSQPETPPVQPEEPETPPATPEQGEVESEEPETEATDPEEEETEETESGESETEEAEPEKEETEETESGEAETEAAEPEEEETEESESGESETEAAEPEQEEVQETESQEAEPEAAGEAEQEERAVPLYFQNDYPNVLYGSGTVKTNGCSVVSLTMVANAVTGYDYEVDELAEYFGGRAENNMARLEKGSETLGLAFHKSKDWHETWAALQEGKIVIALMDGYNGACLFTQSQHFIVLTGLTEDGERILVNDSNRNNYDLWNLKNGFKNGFRPNDILLGYSGAWIYERTLEEQPERYREKRIVKTTANDNYPEIHLTEAERELLARVIWVEARGESAEGQQAVAEVVFNRMVSNQFSNTLHDVIYGEGQFRSVPFLEDAEPTQAQYQAIDRALYGEPILPRTVTYFATFKTNSNIYKQIGNHIFCFG